MEKKKIEIDSAVTIAGVTLVPVVQVQLYCWQGDDGLSFFATKQPVSVVEVSPVGKRAFRMTGEEISVDQLSQEVPAIREMLE